MLTIEDLQRIQQECWADDVTIDFNRMRLWSEQQARDFFESGGAPLLPVAGRTEHARDALMTAMGSCTPNAFVPDVPLNNEASAFTGETTGPEAPPADAGRIFCVSDMHTDHVANLEWCRALQRRRDVFSKDVILVAGDVTANLHLFKETLEILMATFAHVFFVPGQLHSH